MYRMLIHLANHQKQQQFTVGDIVSGAAEVIAPVSTPLSDISVSFHCIGKVKWTDYDAYLDRHVYHDKFDYLKEEYRLAESQNVKVTPMGCKGIHKKFSISFAFTISDDKSLPSSMISARGFVKYFVRVSVRQQHNKNVIEFSKEVIVLSPIVKDLMFTIGGTARKSFLLPLGTVSMHASIGRKGYAPGETVTVTVTVRVEVDNMTNSRVTSRISLTQVQMYMCGIVHKTIDSQISRSPIVGSVVAQHTNVEDELDVTIPKDNSLIIENSFITVKYFVHVTLDIPYSFDLHVILPIVVTTSRVLQMTMKNAIQ